MRRGKKGDGEGVPLPQPTRKSWELRKLRKLPSVVLGEPRPKTILVHFQLENTSDGNKFGIFELLCTWKRIL